MNIDQPFLRDDWVQIHRAKHDVRDPRRLKSRRVASPLLRGRTDDGVWATVDLEAGRTRLGSCIQEDAETGVTRIQAGSDEEADRLIERVRKRAEAEGMTIEIRHREVRRFQPTINTTITVDLVVWARMAAKIALGVGSVSYPAEWRQTDDAQRLRRMLRGLGEDQLYPDRVDADHFLRNLVDPPEHLIYFGHTAVGTVLCVVLFGELMFALPVDASRCYATPDIAWRLDPRVPEGSGSSTLTGLTERVLRRVNNGARLIGL